MSLVDRYQVVREHTERLAAPLSAEDQTVQSMPDCSPAKWHRAHTTWFFETVVLEQFKRDYCPLVPEYRELFNSYYQAVGPQYPRAARGVISRPGIDEVREYRRHVDEQMLELFAARGPMPRDGFDDLVELGINHEEQHQELLLMDINHALSLNPLSPAAYPGAFTPPRSALPATWVAFDSQMVRIGATAPGFAFDNEGPRHDAYLNEFELRSTLVTNREWLEFMRADGYARPEFWLSEGWAICQTEAWRTPMYWRERDGVWFQHTVGGNVELDLDEPVRHISYYEADAFARFAGLRLPTEFEWEHAMSSRPDAFEQVLDACWQWTSSAYGPYPGFTPTAGVVSEYNGKFMSSQMVLRGGCAFTPPGHSRISYRNFFYPHSRWMLSGLRLAR